MSDNPDKLHNGLTYADAGVDIDAGELLVDAIKPLAKSTARPGSELTAEGEHAARIAAEMPAPAKNRALKGDFQSSAGI